MPSNIELHISEAIHYRLILSQNITISSKMKIVHYF